MSGSGSRGGSRSLSARGITPQLIRKVYAETGSVREAAKQLGISPVTLMKYTKGMTKPEKQKAIKDPLEPIADAGWLMELHQAMEEAFVTKKVWIDSKGRKIPQRAIDQFVIQLPDNKDEVVPVYAQLRDGTRTVLLYLTPYRLMGQTSETGSPHTSSPAASDQGLQAPDDPPDRQG